MADEMRVREIIVVEGRDDTAAIKKSVDAVTIETHGYGITERTWKLIEKAYAEKGIIIFTDPDHAGQQIRKRLLQRFPKAKEAFLDRSDAEKAGDIGIENATSEAIRAALEKAHCVVEKDQGEPVSPWRIWWTSDLWDKRIQPSGGSQWEKRWE